MKGDYTFFTLKKITILNLIEFRLFKKYKMISIE